MGGNINNLDSNNGYYLAMVLIILILEFMKYLIVKRRELGGEFLYFKLKGVGDELCFVANELINLLLFYWLFFY